MSDPDLHEEDSLGAEMPYGDLREPPELTGPTGDRAAANLSEYLREIKGVPSLAEEDARALALRVRAGDGEAEQRLVEANLRLVFKLAQRYRNRGLPLADLIEEGNLGLLRAVRNFRPDKGAPFASYATWWIRQALVRALAHQARTIRLPVHIELLLGRYAKEKERLTQELGHPPSLDEVARSLDMPAEQLTELDGIRRRLPSVKPPLADRQTGRLRDVIAGRSTPHSSSAGLRLHEGGDLAACLDDISEKERTVIRLRFGLTGEEPLTPEAVGRRLGLSQERVRQVEASGLEKLRALLVARGVDAADLF